MTTQTLEMNCTLVVDNGKINSIQMSAPIAGNTATPPVTNNLTLAIKDPAMMGLFKAGKNYVLTVSEAAP